MAGVWADATPDSAPVPQPISDSAPGVPQYAVGDTTGSMNCAQATDMPTIDRHII